MSHGEGFVFMKIFYILTIVFVIGAMLFTVRKMVVYKLRKSLAAAWWFVTAFIVMYIGRPVGGDIQELCFFSWVACFAGLWMLTKACLFVEVPDKKPARCK